MTPLRMKVQQFSRCCEYLLSDGTVLSEDEKGLLLSYARELTDAVESDRLDEPGVRPLKCAA